MTTDMLQEPSLGPTAAYPSGPSGVGLAAPSPWPLHLARLTRWEMALLWRRRLTLVLGILFVVGYLAVLAVLLLVNHAASQQTGDANGMGTILGLPGSLVPAAIYASRVLPLLFCILAGAFIGGEYAFGTLRLVLMRGTTRLQLVLAQAAALAIYALLAVAVILVLGLIAGGVLGAMLGISPASWDGVPGELVSYGLAMALSLLLYALVACFFAVLGRSVAAGVGVALGVLFIEGNVLDGLLPLIGQIPGGVTSFFGHLPEWLPVENTTILMAHAGASPLAFSILDTVNPLSYVHTVDGTHALLVTLAYCVLLLGGSYLLLRQRDVKE